MRAALLKTYTLVRLSLFCSLTIRLPRSPSLPIAAVQSFLCVHGVYIYKIGCIHVLPRIQNRLFLVCKKLYSYAAVREQHGEAQWPYERDISLIIRLSVVVVVDAWVQGGEHSQDPLSLRSFSAKVTCIWWLFCKGVKDWPIGASNDEIIDVCTKQNSVSVNDDSLHALFATHSFAAFSLKKSAHRRVTTRVQLTACHKVA